MRAMDTITDVGRSRVRGGPFDKFMVAGASKVHNLVLILLFCVQASSWYVS